MKIKLTDKIWYIQLGKVIKLTVANLLTYGTPIYEFYTDEAEAYDAVAEYYKTEADQLASRVMLADKEMYKAREYAAQIRKLYAGEGA